MGIRRLQDHYAVLAKQEGYPARSIYKLKEILDSHRSVEVAAHHKILDLGAAPGSFSLYFAQHYKTQVVSCDINPLTINHPKISPIYGDFTERFTIAKITEQGPFDLVVSDASSATTGMKLTDYARSLELVNQVWHIAQEVLVFGGHFIAKLLGGGGTQDHQEFIQGLRTQFTKVKLFRPKATRNESGEVYILAFYYKSENSCEDRMSSLNG